MCVYQVAGERVYLISWPFPHGQAASLHPLLVPSQILFLPANLPQAAPSPSVFPASKCARPVHRALDMTLPSLYRDRSPSEARSARDLSRDPPEDELELDEDTESIHLESEERISPLRANLVRALALLCACSLSVGSH